MATGRYSMVARGIVQGVGFRYFVRKSAGKLGLTGWVRNTFDGGVEMEVQGPEERIGSFRAAVQEGPALARVTDLEIVELPVLADEEGFEIRF